MKKVILILAALVFIGSEAYAQKRLTIGDTDYVFQSPFKIFSKTGDTVRVYQDSEYDASGVKRKRYQRFVNDFFVGVGFMCPAGNHDYQSIYYGNSFNFEFGWKFLYRPAKWYGIGTLLQYSAYSYKLKTAGEDVFDLGVATTSGSHYYRTDNIGTGIINRFYLFPGRRYYAKDQVFVELGAWGDYSYSKRLKIKDSSSGHKDKYKYRDGSKFNPFAAGVQGGVGYKCFYLYGKYRLTDSFNHKEVNVNEVERFSIGVQLFF